jgi:stage II sporulation protein AA (anti-sigma F factor antagonist)
MNFAIEKIGAVWLVSLFGTLHHSKVASIKAEFLVEREQGAQQFVLDLSRLAHLSSVGLGLILYLYTQIKQSGGSMVLCAVPSQIRPILGLSGLLSLLPVFETRQLALEKMALI